MKLSQVVGTAGVLAFLGVCILLAESGGAPTQAIGNTNMCVQSGCHTSFPLNLRQDLLTVTGFPSVYTPGADYDVAVAVANNPQVSPSAARAGFAAFVNSDGTPFSGSVGTLTPTDSGIRRNSFSDGRIRIDYLTHNSPRAGSPAATFTFRWTAPAVPNSDAVLVVAGNSANGNGQNTFDFISKRTFTAQAGEPCSFSIVLASQSFAAAGGSGNVSVSAGAGCAWTATSNDSFITISSGGSGSGNGTVGYTVGANAGAARTGTLTIAGQTFTVAQAGAQPQNEKLFFAQFGNGQGITSTFIAMNPSQTETVSGTVRLFDGNGNPLTVNINGVTVAGIFPFDIPPRGIRFFSTDGQGAVDVGSVQVTSNIPIGGTILFAGSLGVAGVGGVQPLAKFLVPIESDSSRGVDTGVAVSNPTGSPVDVTFILRNADGNPLSNGTAVVRLLPNGQLAKFPREIFEGRGLDFSRFRGTLEINSPVPINGMAIRVSPGQFSTLPVAAVN